MDARTADLLDRLEDAYPFVDRLWFCGSGERLWLCNGLAARVLDPGDADTDLIRDLMTDAGNESTVTARRHDLGTWKIEGGGPDADWLQQAAGSRRSTSKVTGWDTAGERWKVASKRGSALFDADLVQAFIADRSRCRLRLGGRAKPDACIAHDAQGDVVAIVMAIGEGS